MLNYNALFVKCRCVEEFGFMDYNKKNILHVVNIYFVIPYFMKGKEDFSIFYLQSLRMIAVNKSFPFLFAPIGNGKSIDGKDRLVFLVGGNA